MHSDNVGDISRIDWNNHDGVNLPMINDYVRNQFYNQIIRDNVQGSPVLDIGFGTGLLSILALQHGASHVVAFESDLDRYALGTEIIDRLKLKDKIKLINQRFYSDNLAEYPKHVIVTETVNGNLWQEGLFNSLPRTAGQTFLPGQYFLNIYAVKIPRVFAQGLGTEAIQPRQFTPGIDINSDFVKIINEFRGISTTSQNQDLPTLKLVDPHVDTNWGWIPYMRCLDAAECVAQYHLDAETTTITTTVQDCNIVMPVDFDQNQHSMTITVDAREPMLLIPRVGMQHQGHVMFLDQGHWGPTQVPCVISDYQGQMSVEHCFLSGDIQYHLLP